jgi:hypothetical protein
VPSIAAERLIALQPRLFSGKFTRSDSVFSGMRLRVVDGGSPNTAQYAPAKRPNWVKRQRRAISVTVTISGSALRSAPSTCINRRRSFYQPYFQIPGVEFEHDICRTNP